MTAACVPYIEDKRGTGRLQQHQKSLQTWVSSTAMMKSNELAGNQMRTLLSPRALPKLELNKQRQLQEQWPGTATEPSRTQSSPLNGERLNKMYKQKTNRASRLPESKVQCPRRTLSAKCRSQGLNYNRRQSQSLNHTPKRVQTDARMQYRAEATVSVLLECRCSQNSPTTNLSNYEAAK